jgi:ribosomal protein S21
LIKRSDNPDVTIRRFFREVQLSGILTEAKKRKYREKEPSRSKRRESARRKAKRNEFKRGW